MNRINSSHSFEDRGHDAYFTPPEATLSLLALEQLPNKILEPACGDGAIVKILRQYGHDVRAADIVDYGFECSISNYLRTPWKTHGIVTNPPYKLAISFAKKAIVEADYVALLLRLNFLEGTKRRPFFEAHPPARILISSRRLPMMHRFGWTGPKAPSNCCYAWFVWDKNSDDQTKIVWFDYRTLLRKIP